MVVYQEQQQELLNLFDTTLSLARTLDQDNMAERLEAAKRDLANSKFLIVVCGEFKRGKSSLANALLDETEDLFPVDTDVTTNLVSTIMYGERERISVLLGEPGSELEERPITRAEIREYVTEQRNPGNARKARLLAIEAPKEWLKDGIILADTPGVGGLNPEHAAITYGFLPDAAAVLFVGDVERPFTAAELVFVRDIGNKNFIFVLTRKDRNPEYQKAAEENRALLAEALGRPGEQLPIVPVSNTAKREYLESGVPRLLELSNFKALEAELSTLLRQRRGRIILERALDELSPSSQALRAPLEAELQGYKPGTPQHPNDPERQLHAARERLRQLTAHKATWQRQIDTGTRDIRQTVLKLFDDKFKQIEDEVRKHLDAGTVPKGDKNIVDDAHEKIAALLLNANEQLRQREAALRTRINTISGLTLSSEVQAPASGGQPDGADARGGWWTKVEDVVHKVIRIGRDASLSGIGGTLVGGVLGGLLGAGAGLVVGVLSVGILAVPATIIGGAIGAKIGAALGSTAAMAFGTKKALSDLRDTDQRTRRRYVEDFLKNAKATGRQGLESEATALAGAMREEFEAKYRLAMETCERTIRAVEEGLQRAPADIPPRVIWLEEMLRRLDGVQASAKAVAQAIAQDSGATAPVKPAVATAGEQWGSFADAQASDATAPTTAAPTGPAEPKAAGEEWVRFADD